MVDNNQNISKEDASQNGEDYKDSKETEILQSLVDSMQQESSEDNIELVSDNTEIDELQRLQQENTDLRDKLLRSVAECENLRRRSEKELKDSGKFAITSFARDLVSVFENLHRAASSINDDMKRENQIVANLAMGVQMTLQEMEKVFAKQQIKRIYPLGELFNHQYHQAMNKVEDADKAEGTIINVMQACYVIHDRLLQPALVTVSTMPTEKPTDNSQDNNVSHVDTTA